jgi:hypothetical protein
VLVLLVIAACDYLGYASLPWWLYLTAFALLVLRDVQQDERLERAQLRRHFGL